MIARLASIVHDGQDAARRQQHHCRDDHKWGDFHYGLDTALADTPRMDYRSCSEPEMNGLFARSPRRNRFSISACRFDWKSRTATAAALGARNGEACHS